MQRNPAVWIRYVKETCILGLPSPKLRDKDGDAVSLKSRIPVFQNNWNNC